MSNQKPQKKASMPVLTPEQQVAALAAVAAREAELKTERERIELFGKAVEKMTHKQLRGELRRAIRRDTHKEGHNAGLAIAFATILLTTLDNTKTRENPFARLSHYLNPAGRPNKEGRQ